MLLLTSKLVSIISRNMSLLETSNDLFALHLKMIKALKQ